MLSSGDASISYLCRVPGCWLRTADRGEGGGGSDGQAPAGELLEAAVEAVSRRIQNIAPLSGRGTAV